MLMKKKSEKEKTRRASRKAREAFRILLQNMHKDGALTLLTRWKEFLPLIERDNDYIALTRPDYNGSTPRQLFADFLDDLEEIYKKDKAKMREYLKEKGLKLNQNVTLPQFTELIRENLNLNIDKVHIQVYYEKLLYDAIQEEKELQRKKQREVQNYMELLVVSSINWVEVRDQLINAQPFIEYETEEDKEKSILYKC